MRDHVAFCHASMAGDLAVTHDDPGNVTERLALDGTHTARSPPLKSSTTLTASMHEPQEEVRYQPNLQLAGGQNAQPSVADSVPLWLKLKREEHARQ